MNSLRIYVGLCMTQGVSILFFFSFASTYIADELQLLVLIMLVSSGLCPHRDRPCPYLLPIPLLIFVVPSVLDLPTYSPDKTFVLCFTCFSKCEKCF